MIYFVSDTHFGHERIIKYCNRPFVTLSDMNLTMIRNWNEVVKLEDTVFHLGDFGFSKSSEAPNAPKNPIEEIKIGLKGDIILIRGNHDRNNKNKTIIESLTINYGGERIFLTHNPAHFDTRYKFNFCGHLHGTKGKFFIVDKSVIVDLSVENWEYRPVNIETIFAAYHRWLKCSKI